MTIEAAVLQAIVAKLMPLVGISDLDFIKADAEIVIEAVNTYCNRTLQKQTGLVDKFRSVNIMRDFFLTRYFPIINVAEVKENDIVLVKDVDYTLDDVGSGRLRRLNGASTSLWRGNVIIQVTYDAGYDPFPSDLLFMLTEVIARDYRRKKQREESDDTMPDVTKMTVFDVGQVEFANISGWQPGAEKMHALFGHYATLLDPYKMPTSAGREPHAAAWLN